MINNLMARLLASHCMNSSIAQHLTLIHYLAVFCRPLPVRKPESRLMEGEAIGSTLFLELAERSCFEVDAP